MIGHLASYLLNAAPWLVLLLVFALPAAESSLFVGFVFPGELALIIGGVLVYTGHLSLPAVLAAGMAGAILGDSVGYAVGRRYGRRVLDGTVGRFVRDRHLDAAQAYLAERGGRAVFFGRFTAALRVLIPGLAGMSGLRYRTFLAYNVSGGIAWVTMSVLLGYLAGGSWAHAAHLASGFGMVVLVLVVAAAVGGLFLRRRAARRRRESDEQQRSPALR